ncbi:molybdate ABC transporter substrate-binding protein [Persephonella atlantica]|uniref:Molybdate ABC transporter substrate-binding protein n=1 Tax=Persephonella atlantica TaxID=2699429 RepID=A0ABS1GIQ1_9AQUI|nr:molybdate ABC transporter substrate-binding protein [Persephonella atlantica]MBK3332765.1 molybdate ABC transporter substrate-binding protein [Persephonella atlantica]
MGFLIAFVLFFSFSYGETLRIAAAANVQYPLREIVSYFKKKYPDIKVVTVVSSSGKLTAQIERGAPYHIFMSANMKYPEYLYERGLTTGKPQVYAVGILVLWSMKNLPLKKEGIKVLLENYIKKISVPNPKNAPYGEEAIRAMKYFGIYRKVKNKLVYGESVSQSTQYIYKRLVDVGFTSKSVVLSPQMKGRGVWIEISQNAYRPIKQGVVILKNGNGVDVAREFVRFLFSSEAKRILKKYGYKVGQLPLSKDRGL